MRAQDAATVNEDGLVVINLSDVEPEEVEWLWPRRIPLGSITNLVGNPDMLKSTIVTGLGARVTTGDEMPDGSESDLDDPAGVLFLMGEDGVAETIRPRVDAAGGDPDRVFVITQVKKDNKRRQLDIQRDAEKLATVIEANDIALVVLDPLTAYLGNANTHKDANVRTALAPLVSLTAETGVATVAIRHLNKDEDKSAMFRSGGSIAFTAVARSELLVGESEDGDKVLAPIKMNLAEKPPALAYEGETAPNGNVRINWKGESLTAPADLLSNSSGGSKKDLAKRLLQRRLTDGPVLAKPLKNEAEDLGVSEATLRRAKDDLGVESEKENHKLGRWKWRLPEEGGDE